MRLTSHAVALATRLAAAQPETTLPCPLCAARVKAPNLAPHLLTTHQSSAYAAADIYRVTGADKRVFFVLAAVLAPSLALVVAVSFLQFRLTDPLMAALAGLFLLSAALLTAAALGLFKAELSLAGEHLRLRWLFGLRSRAVTLPAKIESGAALVRASTHPGISPVSTAGEVVRFGATLRLSSGGEAITVGAPKCEGLGERWAPEGWGRGKSSHGWDITVDREAMVALEYHLAARGLLMPRRG